MGAQGPARGGPVPCPGEGTPAASSVLHRSATALLVNLKSALSYILFYRCEVPCLNWCLRWDFSVTWNTVSRVGCPHSRSDALPGRPRLTHAHTWSLS